MTPSTSSPHDFVALLSGGLDSTVAFVAARSAGGKALVALTADYGQVAAEREIAASRRIAAAQSVPHRVVDLSFLRSLASGNPLVDPAARLPEPTEKEIEAGGEATRLSAAAVWVPNRNGLLVAVAAAFAESLGAGRVITGFNREEAETFPDNSRAFLDAATASLLLSTRNGVRVESPTADLDKAAIVKLGRSQGAPLEHVWSCYRSLPSPCGRCESCGRFRRALRDAASLEWFVEKSGQRIWIQ
jgi:7-cyano-7-deazaguanine synthase